jgi:4-hydroxybenzoate polyprenyltransferase
MFREILMDLNDAEGDRTAGVWTLPVLFGKPYALVCALGCLLAGSCAAAVKLMPAVSLSSAALAESSGDFARWLIGSPVWSWLEAGWGQLGLSAGGWGSCMSVADLAGWLAVAMPVSVLLAAAGKLGRLAFGVWRSGFDTEVVGQAVDECLKPLGWGIILLAAMG